MSGLEQRTKGRDEALAGSSAVIAVTPLSADAQGAARPQIVPAAEWSPIEGDLLDERRASVPAFPLELLPQPWRDWVRDTARSADAPADYVAQALLATVAGVSSARVWVGITQDWVEPLQLWLAVVGAPSTGKSPALALVLRLVDELKLPRMQECDRRPPRIILYGGTMESIEDELADSRVGQLLWRDGAEGCFTPLKRMASARHLEALPVSILGSIEPDGVAQALQRGGEGLAARFLYA